MRKQNISLTSRQVDEVEKAVSQKYQKRNKKKRRTMKVSGGKVRDLQKIIKDKRKL